MSLPTGDLFAGIVATFFAADLGGLHRLAVDDRRRGRRFLPCGDSHSLPQGVVDLLPQTFLPPSPEYRVNRLPFWKVVGQGSPLAACAIDVENSVDDFPTVHRRPSSLLPRRQQFADDLPLLVRDIAGIIRPIHGYGSVFLDLNHQRSGAVTFLSFHVNLKTASKLLGDL